MAEGLVPVQILGQRYPIRSALDPRYVQELANYVDEKMRAAADASPAGDSLRLAVVVALNLADEAFRARGADAGEQAAVTDRLTALERLIDEALAS
ncbi:MAG: cell division protein ZapA [Acidobacteria bacterium]|nr:cell division protein ZapA [Acidobacteriota bacterium]